MEKVKRECDPLYHHFYALEPFAKETGEVTILLVCTNCGKPIRYDFHLDKVEGVKVTE